MHTKINGNEGAKAMNMILDEFISAVRQLITFTVIPLIWWIFTARKKENFFFWLGMRPVKMKPGNWKVVVICLCIFLAYCLMVQFYIIPNLNSPAVVADAKFSGMGFGGIIPAIFYAVVQTGLSEEILFRGFLGKRLSARFGFRIGNIVQGLIFGLVHGILFFAVTTPFNAVLIILVTGSIGWVMGYLDETAAGGSIIPSWLVHGGGNLIFAALKLFNII